MSSTEDTSKKKNIGTVRNLAAGASGAYIMKGNTSRLLGYHNVYHGTSNSTAKEIKKNGLDPSKGGKNGGAGHIVGNEDFIRKSKGKVHVSKYHHYARMYAGLSDTSTKGIEGNVPEIMKRAVGNAVKGRGKVVKAKLTDSEWKRMKLDTDGGANKKMAATTEKAIPSSRIHGSKDFKGIRGVVNKNTLRKYYNSAEGKKRVQRAGIRTAIGTAAIVHSAKKLKEKYSKE